MKTMAVDRHGRGSTQRHLRQFWERGFDHLSEKLTKMRKVTAMSDEPAVEISIVRDFDAPHELVGSA